MSPTGRTPAPLTSDALFEAFASDLARFFAARVRHAADVDDLVQETFLRVHRGLAGLRDGERVAGWLLRIARNVLADHRRRAPGPLPLDDDVRDDGEPDASAARGVGRWLVAQLDALPASQRDVVRLFELDDLPQAEIAARLGLGVGAVKARLRRGRASLRERLARCCDVELDRRGGVRDAVPRGRCDCGGPAKRPPSQDR